jgi:hypothetical protein
MSPWTIAGREMCQKSRCLGGERLIQACGASSHLRNSQARLVRV